MYITQLVSTDRPKTFYALIITVPMLITIVTSPFVGKLADSYCNVGVLFLVGSAFQIIGNRSRGSRDGNIYTINIATE